MQSLTRIFSKGLAVAFGIVVLAVLFTPAYGSSLDQEFKFKVRNRIKCGGNSPSIWAKFFHWDNSTESPGGLKKQKKIAPGKSNAFNFGVRRGSKYRYFELRAEGVMIAKGVIRMTQQSNTRWVQFDGYESDNFKVKKSKNASEFVLDIKMKKCP
jgi:hypothetical protein